METLTSKQQKREELQKWYEQKEFLLKQESYKNDLFKLAKLMGFDDLGVLHRDVCDKLKDTQLTHKRRLFLLPRGHFKTSLLSNAYIVQCILKDPNIRVLLASSTLQNVKNSLKVIKNTFMTNMDFRAIFPEFCPPEDCKEWGTQEKFTVPNRTNQALREGTVEVSGVGQTIIGRHFNKIILSDIVTTVNSNTKDQIAKTAEWVAMAVPLLNKAEEDEILMEGTRYDYDDIFGEWEERAVKDPKKYFVYKRPCIEVVDGKEVALFPEWYTVKGLKNIRIEEGSYVFSSQYMLEPIDSETAPFKKKEIQYIERLRLPKGRKLADDKHDRLPRFMAIDPAISEDSKADYSCVSIASFDQRNSMYVIDIKFGHWNTSKLIDTIIWMNEKYEPKSIAIEVVAYQKLLANILLEYTKEKGIVLPLYELKRNTHESKAMRIMSLQPRF